MSGTGKELFDEKRIVMRYLRARKMHGADSQFLARHAGTEIASRVEVTNRKFTRPLILDAFPDVLAETVKSITSTHEPAMVDLPLSADDMRLGREQFDLVIAGLALHRRNDLPGTLTQIRQALKPDGLFIGAIPGEGTLEELRMSLLAAESAFTAGAAMRIEPFTDVRQAGSLLQRAGFTLPVTDTETLDLRYGEIDRLIDDLRANGATSVLTGHIQPITRQADEAARANYRSGFADGEGRLIASVKLIYLTGWAPHESQQKPLRPGTAQYRLEDFLNPRNR